MYRCKAVFRGFLPSCHGNCFFLDDGIGFSYILYMKYTIRNIGEISDDFKPQGALEDCFGFYLNFKEDFELLVSLGYVMIESPETCKWLKSKTSLAEYLFWANGEEDDEIGKPYVPGGFWAPAEEAFRIKRHSLRKLAGNNGNIYKPDDSKDFLKLKPHLEEFRKQQKSVRKEAQIFRYIKELILLEAEDEKPETIHNVLEKISMLFIVRNVDKKNIKPLLKKPLDTSL
jgi:hypothetical protein